MSDAPTRRPDSDFRDQCAVLVGRMRPGLVAARIGEWVRGGLPGMSLPSGSPSADRALPHLDRDDTDHLALLENYHAALGRYMLLAQAERWKPAYTALVEAWQIETGVIPELHMRAEDWLDYRRALATKAAEEVAPKAADCGNPNCQRTVPNTPDDRLRHGLCHRCYRFVQKHGYHRPTSLCAQDIERHLAS